MIGSFLTRGLVLVFGYIYPAYECFKSVEMNKPDIDQLRFWCQYWILVAGLTVCERIGDAFIGWVPMYGEAKLAFFIYLWFPKTKGTTYVYDSFFRPYVAQHETEIDRSLLELRTRAGDMAVLYWQKVASYGQTRVFDILQYIASQSSPPQPGQRQQLRVPSKQRSGVATQTQDGQPSSPGSDASSSEQRLDSTEEAGSSSKAAPTAVSELKTTPALPILETTKSSSSTVVQVMQIDSVPPAAKETTPPPPQVVIEEPVRVTRARSRRTRPPSSDRGDKV
ncbi:Abscisic acid-responsive family protein [Perilla frutescens var. hirtella]|nr:Abscisic acid-responsive family protein [Perilla frutescens var. frutescens]KAH6775086.1 Abscisic acid-responsive family protein [Perilla frutescens var. hirtella]